MKKLWQDIQAHKRAAVLFLIYWLATVVVTFITWDQGIPSPVVLLTLTIPLFAGILVGLWRISTPELTARFGDKTGGGILAGLLCAEITFLVMKGGLVEEVIVWIRVWEISGKWGEVLVFAVVFGVFGIILGFTGAAFASFMEHFRNRLTRHSS